MNNARKKKKKTRSIAAWLRSRPFMLLAFGLAMMTLALVIQLPRMMGGLERQDTQLTQKMKTYSDLQSQRNVLMSELQRVNNKEYIETLARREHGYGWYGETIYEVGNLAEIQAAQNSGN